MAKNDFFAIEGLIIELDSSAENRLTKVFLGGLEGVRPVESSKDASGNSTSNKIRPVFYGEDLLKASERFRDLTFTFSTNDNFEGASGSGLIAGSLSMFFIVS